MTSAAEIWICHDRKCTVMTPAFCTLKTATKISRRMTNSHESFMKEGPAAILAKLGG